MTEPCDFGATFSFSPFRLDAANERLYRLDRVIPLRPKTFAVLRHLVERAGRLVSKDELLDVVWAGIHVSDAVLKGCIKEIREALGDDPSAPRLIETQHRRGYRFIGTLNGFTDGASTRRAAESRSTVGRETELARMRAWLEQSLAGERRIVFVTGEPGIGKTTLVEAFLDEIAARPAIRIGRGQCLEHYGAGEAYLPILEALTRLCTNAGGERLVTLLRQHAPTWLAQVPSLASAADLDALSRQLLGATPQRMLREMADAVHAFTIESPVVLVLEDLHWSDYSTLDLLASLAKRREAARLLIIGTYRPADASAGRHPLSDLKLDLQLHRRCDELPLAELKDEAVAAYLGTRFERHRFPADLACAIHRRTEGHPLFMVSLVDDLQMRGTIVSAGDVWELMSEPSDLAPGVPENIRQMIERQIAHLGEDERALVEAASVAGLEFSCAAIAAVLRQDLIRVERTCDALARRQCFLRSSPPAELADGTFTSRYRFIHALYRTVLYDQVPAARRAQLHRFVAEDAEARHGDRSSEIAAELALHFEEGRDATKALKYLQQAAGNAARRSANREVVALAERGLALLARQPANVNAETAGHAEPIFSAGSASSVALGFSPAGLSSNAAARERAMQELALQMTLGSALIAIKGYSAPEVERVYARARALCGEIGDAPDLFRVLWGLARFYLVRTPLDTARQFGEELLRLAERAGDSDLLLQAHNSLGAPLFHLGEFERARMHLERGLALYDAERHRSHAYLYVQDPRVVCLARSALALWCLGCPDQAVERSDEAVAFAGRLSHPFSEAFALNFAAMLHELRREPRKTRALAEAGIAVSIEQGFTVFVIMGKLLLGAALAAGDAPGEGRAMMRESANAAAAAGAELIRSYGLGILARACAKDGCRDEARSTVADALAIADRSGEGFYKAELHRLQGELALASAEADAHQRAEACFRQALDVAERQHAKSWTLRASMSLARLRGSQGRREEAQAIVSTVMTSFTEGFETQDLIDAKEFLEAYV